MRVLFIAHEQRLNGASKSMLNLIDELSDRVEFFVLLPIAEGRVTDELDKRGIMHFYLPMKFWMSRKDGSVLNWIKKRAKWYIAAQFQNKKLADEIIRIVEEYKIDIIHTNVSTLNLGALVHKKTGIPHVWHVREFGEEDFSILPRCSWRKFYKTFDEGASSVITISKALCGKYKKHLKKITPVVVYNGVDTGNELSLEEKRKAAIERICRNEPVNFLITGVVIDGKGQDVAVEAAAKLIADGESDFKLYVAGHGNEEWLKSTEGFSDEHIELLGQVENMSALRKTMDVELVCSRCEAFGRVTVEAMMGCMPVIGSNSGGTPELINDGATGYLYEQGNADELAERMKYFIHHRDKILEMGETAQRNAMRKFTIDICAENIYQEYCAVLDGVGGGIR